MSNSDSPLHLAVRNNNIDIVKMLLEGRCDVHAVNAEGLTPLQLATQESNTEMIALLLQHGAGNQPKPIPEASPNIPHPQSKPSVPLTPLEQRKQKITFWTKLYSIAFAVYMLGDILYNFCCIGALSDGSADIYDLYEAMQGFSMMSWILGIPAGIFIAVTFYFFVVRIWEEVPTEFARTTPQKAAGLSFIPFYNFYWWFQCFLGLFQDMNKVTEHYGKGAKFFAPLIQGACIFWVAACVIELILTDEIGILGRYGYRIFLSFVNAGVTIPILWYIRQQVLNFIDFKTEIGIETSDHRS